MWIGKSSTTLTMVLLCQFFATYFAVDVFASAPPGRLTRTKQDQTQLLVMATNVLPVLWEGKRFESPAKGGAPLRFFSEDKAIFAESPDEQERRILYLSKPSLLVKRGFWLVYRSLLL